MRRYLEIDRKLKWYCRIGYTHREDSSYGICRYCSETAFVIVDNADEDMTFYNAALCRHHLNTTLLELEMKGFHRSSLDMLDFE